MDWAEDVLKQLKKATWVHPKAKNKEAKPYTKASINRFMSLLGTMQRYAHKKKYHTSLVQMPKLNEGKDFKRRPLTNAEYEAMRGALKAPPNPDWARFADLLAVLWGTACRLGEVVKLEWAQIDWEANVIIWPDTKGGLPVAKPMNQSVREVLKARRKTNLRRPFADYSNHQLRECWDWLCEQAKVTDRKRVVPHSIRHRGITQILRSRRSSAEAQKMAGHASYATTQRYEHLVVEDLRDAAEALS
ncbi:tyrosine-type recombinase/integrase [Aquabacterium sp.]|uniref:tyrosine-type recombinase/integrase n=1 Tax=Aquabacterium sp. TaxID=1872578 RepID=UPI004037EA54